MKLQRPGETRTWTRPDSACGEPWASESEVSDLLYALVRAVKPEQILEIGTFEGHSAIAMGRACSANGFGSVETWDVKDFGQFDSTNRAGLGAVVLCGVAPNGNLGATGQYDFIFIDAGHSEPEVTRDLAFAHQHLRPGGYILGHDVCICPPTAEAHRKFRAEHPEYDSVTLGTYCGLFVMRRT